MFPPKFYFNNYGLVYEHWALVFSITAMNASIQLGPFWVSVAWKEYF